MVDRLMTHFLLVYAVAGTGTVVVVDVVAVGAMGAVGAVGVVVALLVPLFSCVLILWGCPPKMCLPKVLKL